MARYKWIKLMHEESSDLADFLKGLSEQDWDTASLCVGWRVREVVGHMAAGHTSSLTGYFLELAKAGFSIDRTSDNMAREYAATHTSAQSEAEFRKATAGRPKGPTALVPPWELFTDHLIHHQDIRRALDRPRTIPDERLAAALASMSRLSGRVGSKARMRGLQVVADDCDYKSKGHGGAMTRGPGEALLMALCGREPAAVDLRGDGAELLRQRLASEATARRQSQTVQKAGSTA